MPGAFGSKWKVHKIRARANSHASLGCAAGDLSESWDHFVSQLAQRGHRAGEGSSEGVLRFWRHVKPVFPVSFQPCKGGDMTCIRGPIGGLHVVRTVISRYVTHPWANGESGNIMSKWRSSGSFIRSPSSQRERTASARVGRGCQTQDARGAATGDGAPT